MRPLVNFESMTTILFPTDFSSNAERTIRYVLDQLNHEKIKAVIYHSIEPPKSAGGSLVNIERQMTEIAVEQMDTSVNNLKKEYSISIEGVCRAGFMDDNLNDAMKANHAKLCIMCSKGESDIASKVFGSNAEHCLKKSMYPIWVLPTELPERMEDFVLATEDGYLHGTVFLELFFGLLKSDGFNLSKLKVVTNAEEANTTYRQEQFMGKEIELNTVHEQKALNGINQWLETHPEVDTLILNSKHKKWYDFLLNNSTTQKLAASLNFPLLSLPNLK